MVFPSSTKLHSDHNMDVRMAQATDSLAIVTSLFGLAANHRKLA